MKSRRQFLQHCSSALLGAAAVPALALPGRPVKLPSFTAFSQQVSTTFLMTADTGAAMRVVLEEARPHLLRSRPELADHRNFFLRFTGEQTGTREQGNYAFHHPELGLMDIFVVPNVCPETGRINYLAVFQGAPFA